MGTLWMRAWTLRRPLTGHGRQRGRQQKAIAGKAQRQARPLTEQRLWEEKDTYVLKMYAFMLLFLFINYASTRENVKV